MEEKLEKAARRYIGGRPKGQWDKAGRFYPADEERCSCCDGIRSPSRAWPKSLWKHCQTYSHIACLYGVEIKALKRAVKELSFQEKAEIL